jgi:hypothetical protein
MTDDFRDWAKATAAQPPHETTQPTFDKNKAYSFALGEMVNGRSPSINEIADASGSLHGARLAMGCGRNSKGGLHADREKVRKKKGEAGPSHVYPPTPRNKALLYLALVAAGQTDEALARDLSLESAAALHAAIRQLRPLSPEDAELCELLNIPTDELLTRIEGNKEPRARAR